MSVSQINPARLLYAVRASATAEAAGPSAACVIPVIVNGPVIATMVFGLRLTSPLMVVGLAVVIVAVAKTPEELASPRSYGGVTTTAKAFGKAMPRLPVSNIVLNNITDILEFNRLYHSIFVDIAYATFRLYPRRLTNLSMILTHMIMKPT